MRSTFILYILVLASFVSLKAQSYEHSYDHHDISIAYGAFIPDQFRTVESTMLDDLFPDKRYVRDRYASMGVLLINYRHMLRNEFVFLGVSAAYSSSSSEIYNVGQFEGDLDRQFITAAIEAEFRWVNLNMLQVYSGVALGYTYATESLTPPAESGAPDESGNISTVAYQLNGAGIRIGRKFAGFIEFGYGFKGIVNVGFSAQFF